MKKITIALLALTFLLTGCNTLNGLGKDVEILGGKVQDATKK